MFLRAFCILNIIIYCAAIEELYRWKQITFDHIGITNDDSDVTFPDPLTLDVHEEDPADYIPYNNVPMGVTHYQGILFITVPRRRPGIPSTLNYINIRTNPKGSSPVLKAYPNHSMNKLHPQLISDFNRLVSVYRTRVDECNRLWFVDTGMLEYPNNFQQIQRPSIWIIDLINHKLVRRFDIPATIVEQGNGMPSITVDVDKNNCNDAYAYIPDIAKYRIYIYSFSENRIWTINHNYFNFDPLSGDLNVAGQKFQWNDGVFSITLGKPNPDGFRTVYFHPMASLNEFAISSEILKNETLSTRSYHDEDFKLLGTRGAHSQSTMHDYDEKTGIIFYALVGLNGISCWNTAKPFSVENHPLIAQNNETMLYPSDLQVDSDGTLWVMSNTMPKFIYDRLNVNQYNFRVWTQNGYQAVSNTVCSNTDSSDIYYKMTATTKIKNPTYGHGYGEY